MGSNELAFFTVPNRAFTYREARGYNKYRNMQPTINQLCWRGAETGGAIAFIDA